MQCIELRFSLLTKLLKNESSCQWFQSSWSPCDFTVMVYPSLGNGCAVYCSKPSWLATATGDCTPKLKLNHCRHIYHIFVDPELSGKVCCATRLIMFLLIHNCLQRTSCCFRFSRWYICTMIEIPIVVDKSWYSDSCCVFYPTPKWHNAIIHLVWWTVIKGVNNSVRRFRLSSYPIYKHTLATGCDNCMVHHWSVCFCIKLFMA